MGEIGLWPVKADLRTHEKRRRVHKNRRL